jgi:hypothetical protein
VAEQPVPEPTDPTTRQLDPEVLRWIREQPCGVVIDVVTGVVRREPSMPLMMIALDTSDLDMDALREFHERQAADLHPSDAPLDESLRALNEQLREVGGEEPPRE